AVLAFVLRLRLFRDLLPRLRYDLLPEPEGVVPAAALLSIFQIARGPTTQSRHKWSRVAGPPQEGRERPSTNGQPPAFFLFLRRPRHRRRHGLRLCPERGFLLSPLRHSSAAGAPAPGIAQLGQKGWSRPGAPCA